MSNMTDIESGTGADPSPTEALEVWQRGDRDKAWDMYQTILANHPDNPILWNQVASLCMQRGDLDQAVHCVEKALTLLPDHPVLLGNLGKLWQQKQAWHKAIEVYRKILQQQDDHVEALHSLGHLCLVLRQGGEAVQVLSKLLQMQPSFVPAHELLYSAYRTVVDSSLSHPHSMFLLSNYHLRMAYHYANKGYPFKRPIEKPTFFANREQAWQAAAQGGHFCYHGGAAFVDAPVHLKAIPDEQEAQIHFFLTTRFPLPQDVAFDPAVLQEQSVVDQVIASMAQARNLRFKVLHQAAEQCRNSQPTWQPGEPLRVFIPVMRHRPGFRLYALSQERSFRKAGCEVMFFEEAVLDDFGNTESLGFHHYLQAMAEFNPHLVVDVNANFYWHSSMMFSVHQDVFRLIAFYDPVQMITDGRPIPWRERDLIYGMTGEIEQMLHKTGATHARSWELVYFEDAFCFRGGRKIKNKIVWASTAFTDMVSKFPGCEAVLREMETVFSSGEVMTHERLEEMASRSHFSKHQLRTYLWASVVRIGVARWLCEIANEKNPEIEVEIYGSNWQLYPEVAAYHKRALLPSEVPDVYQDAQYVLSVHPYNLQNPRLLEAAACEAVPVVFDCRALADKPHWDDYCLWFHTKEELRACFSRQPPLPPREMCKGRSAGEFAVKIVNEIKERW
ncbi:MAG: tetratricopeptide repeat protein [Magnetococcales bacterium]|nr:tetratricopeptide repeat protein [Magnetococcales bacterium]MBF0116255.1 tetratricopeptide repeat protein [Magnetococcales bacterium]